MDAFLDGARELVDLGAEGITTNCGFLSIYQAEIARHVGVPVATSSLLQAAFIESLLAPGRRVGILTISAKTLTGEVSAAFLKELGVAGAIVGHSERRHYFGETDATTAKRADQAFAWGLRVIACVGETEAEREADETEEVLRRQVAALPPHPDLVVAYEPVWAIGTGKTATPELAQEAHAFIKTLIDAPVLYGGSVKPDNAAELLSQPDVDGALVGGASLDPESFTAICRAAIPS